MPAANEWASGAGPCPVPMPMPMPMPMPISSAVGGFTVDAFGVGKAGEVELLDVVEKDSNGGGWAYVGTCSGRCVSGSECEGAGRKSHCRPRSCGEDKAPQWHSGEGDRRVWISYSRIPLSQTGLRSCDVWCPRKQAILSEIASCTASHGPRWDRSSRLHCATRGTVPAPTRMPSIVGIAGTSTCLALATTPAPVIGTLRVGKIELMVLRWRR